MPFYHSVGKLPEVKHTTFYKEDGISLYREELVSSKGFSGIYSNLYHHHLPSGHEDLLAESKMDDLTWEDPEFGYFHCNTDKSPKGGDFIHARECYFRNQGTAISLATVTESTNTLYRNARAAEFIFVHHGQAILKSPFGQIPLGPGHQIVIPKGTIYHLDFSDYVNNKILVIESSTPFEIPAHFKNESGQLAEHAPYSERDFRLPELAEPKVDAGPVTVLTKVGVRLLEHSLDHHPFDVVGWDGYLYPFAFNIKDYHPKVGRIHLPPPVHLLYTTAELVICNFVPRPFDFHENAIPAPYYHNNIDSDEVLYYLDGDFMSRKGVKSGSITLHQGGIPHGPQPGRTEASVGVDRTEEYALMIDTFKPLDPTTRVRDTRDPDYFKSWRIDP